MNASLLLHDKNSFTHRRLRFAPGFTLTEILIAIALIVTIVAVAVANYVPIYTNGQTQAARIFVTDGVDTVLTSYRVDTGNFPTTEQGLSALLVVPENVVHWNGPYFKNPTLPLDPWQHAYHYAYPGVHNPKGYDVWSDGPDGLTGTTDDIGNW